MLAAVLVALSTEWASAQQGRSPIQAEIVQGYRLGKAEAEKLEAALTSKADDLAARARLLGYYFRGAGQEAREARIAARRRHILWVIEHYPGSELAGLPAAAIDPTFLNLADKEGYDQASKLWLRQAQRHGGDAVVLGNAAWFFQARNREQAETLLKRAQLAAPSDPQWARRLGHL